MTDFDQFEPSDALPPRREKRSPWPIVAGAAALVVVAVLLFLWWRKPPPAPAPAPVAAAAEEPQPASPPEAEEPDFELPPLSASDAVVRALVESVTSHPQVASWLVTDDLARRFTAVVTNLANGESPRSHISFMAPPGEFEALRRDGELVMAAASYDRYDTLVEALDSVDSAGAAELYAKLEPLFEQSYRELGYPDGSFREVLLQAIRHLLSTPIPDGAVRLEPKVESYELADPRLEELSEAQKHLLRMGPENAERVQAKLRELALALGFRPEQFL